MHDPSEFDLQPEISKNDEIDDEVVNRFLDFFHTCSNMNMNQLTVVISKCSELNNGAILKSIDKIETALGNSQMMKMMPKP